MKEENFKISFIDKMEPELEAGEYIVTAGIHIKSINYHQTSSDKKADINKAKTIKILPNTLRFIINAHRFSLPPSEILVLTRAEVKKVILRILYLISFLMIKLCLG